MQGNILIKLLGLDAIVEKNFKVIVQETKIFRKVIVRFVHCPHQHQYPIFFSNNSNYLFEIHTSFYFFDNKTKIKENKKLNTV
jgi:hypothetical protein